MRIFWKILITFVVLPVAVVGLFYFLDQSGYFNLTKIEIIIDNSVASKLSLKSKVADAAKKLETYRGQSLWHLKLKEINQILDQEKWVDTFRISRQWPAKLQINITPSPVYFVYMNNKGEFFPVIKGGLILESVGAMEWPDVPITRNSEFVKSEALRTKAIRLLRDIPLQGSFSRAQISELHHDEKNGFSFTLMRDGLVVKMGEEQVRTKSLRVSQVIEYLESKKFQARVIDANLSQKVLVRLRKDP